MDEFKIDNNLVDQLSSTQYDSYCDGKFEEYKSCNHILVYSSSDYDHWEGRTYKSLGCVKCGMDETVVDHDRQRLSLDQKTMYDYLRKHSLKGISTMIQCNLDVAMQIYAEIRDQYPDIEDEMAAFYLKMQLEKLNNENQEQPIGKQKKLTK